MKTKFVNPESLISIELFMTKECEHFTYRPLKKFWGMTFDEGFLTSYDSLFDVRYTKEELENGEFLKTPMIIVNNVVFYSPYAKLVFKNKNTEFKYFKTDKELNDWANEFATTNCFIKL